MVVATQEKLMRSLRGGIKYVPVFVLAFALSGSEACSDISNKAQAQGPSSGKCRDDEKQSYEEGNCLLQHIRIALVVIGIELGRELVHGCCTEGIRR